MWKDKSLTIELVTRSKNVIFQLRVSNSKVEKLKLKCRVRNSKRNLMFFEVELATRRKNLFKKF